MTDRAKNMNTILAQLEDELLASTDADIVAAPDASQVSQRVAALIERQLLERTKKSMLPVRAPSRRYRRNHSQDFRRPSKRQLVDRVLVASPKAQTLVKPAQVAMMSEEELDEILLRMRALGFLGSDD